MKKISILLLVFVAALASCKKTPEVNLKYVDVERDLVTVGTTVATFQCDYDYITTLKKAYLYYGEGEDETDMTSTEMQVVQKTLYAELTDLKENTTYSYYYEFVNGFNSMRSAMKTFKTEKSPDTPPAISLPTVITAQVTEITANSAKSGGEVTNDGGTEVIERGICWSTTANPTISDSHVAAGTGTGAFTATMSGLEANTSYHVRAYAINEKGTAYGLDVEFITLSSGGTAQLPVVVSNEVTGITAHSASCSGEVTNDGGATVTDRGICWSTNVNPTISNSHVSAGTGTGAFSVMISGLIANTTYYVRAYATNEAGTVYGENTEFTTLEGGGTGDHEWVDLGLPSGTLWATCNVGASAPEDYGDYFAWGETTPKTACGWVNYQHCNGSSGALTKYCNDYLYGDNGFTDNLTVLQPIDDAATVNWGDGWCMPTYEQCQELRQYTSQTWTSQNGVHGRLFTAANGNSLFLPAAGYIQYNNFVYADDYGYYWSSSLYSNDPRKGWFLIINSAQSGPINWERCFGKPVRPVRSYRK